MKNGAFVIWIVVLILFATGAWAQSCEYHRGPKPDTTITKSMVVTERIGSVREIQGVVMDRNHSPLPGALLALHRRSGRGEGYLGFQRADSEGRFCFGGVRSGEYELQTEENGFKRTDLIFHVRRRRGKARIEVVMEVGV